MLDQVVWFVRGLASMTAAEFESVLYAIVFGVTMLSTMLFGLMVMTFGRGAFSALWLVSLTSGATSIALLGLSGGRMLLVGTVSAIVGLLGGIFSGVIAMMAHRLEHRLIERRARRIGKGGAAKKH